MIVILSGNAEIILFVLALLFKVSIVIGIGYLIWKHGFKKGRQTTNS